MSNYLNKNEHVENRNKRAQYQETINKEKSFSSSSSNENNISQKVNKKSQNNDNNLSPVKGILKHAIKRNLSEKENFDILNNDQINSSFDDYQSPIKTEKNKKLKIETNKEALSSPELVKTNSAVLPSHKSLNVKKINRMKRMSTLGARFVNKSIANAFELKDIKELEKSANEETNVSETVEHKLHGRSLFIFSKTNNIRKAIK